MVLIIVSFLTACSSSTCVETAEVFLELVSFNIQSNANNNSAVALDLVILYDKTLINKFLGMSASSYFGKKKQLTLDYPVQMQVKNWEIVPGQKVTPYKVTFEYPLPQAAFFYAKLSSSGEHRQRVGDQKGLQIVLGKSNMSLRQLSSTELSTLLASASSSTTKPLPLASSKTSKKTASKTAAKTACSNCCFCCNSESHGASTTNKAVSPVANNSSTNNFSDKNPVKNLIKNTVSASKNIKSGITANELNPESAATKKKAGFRKAAAADVIKDLAAAKKKAGFRKAAAADVKKDLAAAQKKAGFRKAAAADVIKDLAAAKKKAGFRKVAAADVIKDLAATALIQADEMKKASKKKTMKQQVENRFKKAIAKT